MFLDIPAKGELDKLRVSSWKLALGVFPDADLIAI